MSVLSIVIHAILPNAIHKNFDSVYTIRELSNHHVNSTGCLVLLLCIPFTVSIDLHHLPSTLI